MMSETIHEIFSTIPTPPPPPPLTILSEFYNVDSMDGSFSGLALFREFSYTSRCHQCSMAELGECVKTNCLPPHIKIIEARESIMASDSIFFAFYSISHNSLLATDSEERPVFLLV